MKQKTKTIKVRHDAWYEGQEMPWTEIMEPAILEKGSTVWHWGGELKAFLAKQTCFFRDVKKLNEGWLYSLTVSSDTPVETDENEVRVDLTTDMKLQCWGFFWRGEAYEQEIDEGFSSSLR